MTTQEETLGTEPHDTVGTEPSAISGTDAREVVGAEQLESADVGAGRRHLLSISDLGAQGIEEVLRVSDAFVEVSRRAIPKVPALRGKTVVTLFVEESTRTKLSFETAAKRLSADVLSFNASSSSLSKGESLRDTVETISAMGVDAFVVRHPSAGAPAAVARWVDACVLNAGDGWHEHPTQALLDCYTIRQVLAERGGGSAREAGVECFKGLRVAIVGDIRHSRVARSNVLALWALGAEVTLVAPGTLLPPAVEAWPVAGVSHDLDAVLPEVDVCYMLRLQTERGTGRFLPSLREYSAAYGLNARRASNLVAGALVMHPGPMNRGIEISDEVADLPRSLILRQVANGVAVRMAVMFMLLGTPQGKSPTRALASLGDAWETNVA